MANQRKRRLYSFIHVAEAIWNCLCMFLHDLFTPDDFLEIGFNGYDHHSRHATIASSIPGTSVNTTSTAICSRQCPGCYQWLKLEEFLGLWNDTEFLYCLRCRNNGKPQLPFTVWSHPISTTSSQNAEQRQSYYSDRYGTSVTPVYILKPKVADYFEVDIDEASQFWLDPLVYGEQFTTWADLSDESPKTIKKRRRNRKRSRRCSMLPWTYSSNPENDFEQDFRDRCERLWRYGFDENLPDSLLTTNSWSKFWKNYENRTTLQCV